MRKKIIVFCMIAIFALLNPFQLENLKFSNAADKVDYQCSMTITTKNTYGNFAYPTGHCNGFFKGYYVEGDFMILGSWTGETYDGHKIYRYLPIEGIAGGFPHVELTVHTKVIKDQTEEPKKEEPKQISPTNSNNNSTSTKSNNVPTNKSSDAKTNTTPKKNTTNQVKSNNVPTNKSSDAKTNTTPKKNTTNQVKSTTTPQKPTEVKPKKLTTTVKKETKQVSKSTEPTKSKSVSNANKEWTIEELKKNNAKVVYESGKYFAVVDGMKKEITEEQAKELGIKVKEKQEPTHLEKQSEENKQTAIHEQSKSEKPKTESKQGNSKVWFLLGGLVVLAGAILVGYYSLLKRKNSK